MASQSFPTQTASATLANGDKTLTAGVQHPPIISAHVIHHDYTPEKIVELLQEMKNRGRAVTVSETGELLNIDVAIKFYSGLCAASQTLRT